MYQRAPLLREWPLPCPQNWAGTSPKLQVPQSFTPTSQTDLLAIIQGAVQSGRRLRCVGHAHTWTPVFADDEVGPLSLAA